MDAGYPMGGERAPRHRSQVREHGPDEAQSKRFRVVEPGHMRR